MQAWEFRYKNDRQRCTVSHFPSVFPVSWNSRSPVAWSNMARRKESEKSHQTQDDSDSNPNDEMEDEPDFEDPEGFVDDISEEGT